jgi:hypothetical protein
MWQSNPTPEVRALLLEIYRVRDIAWQAYGALTITRMWGVDKPFLARLNALDSVLFWEPCLRERPVDWSAVEEHALKRLSRGRR